MFDMDGSAATVRALVDRMATARPAADFLIDPETGSTLTFAALQRNARQLGGRLGDAGLQRGDKIAFLMDNGLFAAQLFLGAMYGGFVAVPLNVRAGTAQLAYTLAHCDAPVLFVGAEHRALADAILPQVARPIRAIPVARDGGAWCDGASVPQPALPPLIAEDAALLMYTSGSTGQPKGAIHTHRAILAHGRNSVQAHRLTQADRSLLVLPLYHINAECVTLIPTLLSGGSVVVAPHFAAGDFWNWLLDWGCTWSAIVPTIISQLLAWDDLQAESRAEALRRIRFLRSSSAPLSPALHREFIDRFALPLIQAMGSTEAGNVFSNPVPPGENKIGSPGLPWGFEMRIVDRTGADLPAGEPGEVLLRGDALMQAYYKDPDGTAAAVDAEGWLHTGDLAYRDPDGYVFVVGRSKELVIKGGMNIAPKQIDEVLESHPAVREAAAVGIPDRYLGEDLVAFAVLRDGVACDEAALLAFCESQLGHFKTPTRIHFVPDLPKGPSGKVQRLRLVDDGARLAAAAAPALAAQADGAGIEAAIAGVWSELLDLPQIDPAANFFALGGQSLIAIQCLSRLRERLPVTLSLAEFFENPSIAQQAALVRQRLAQAPEAAAALAPDRAAIPLRDRTVPYPLSPAQARVWFMHRLNPEAPAYNEAEAVRLQGTLDLAALEQALDRVVNRHEMLRSTIEERADGPVAVVHPAWPVRLRHIDLQALAPAAREAELARLLVEEPRLPYRLEAEPGVRATVVALAPDEHAIILMLHHITCDSASLGILWRELGAAYAALRQGRPAALPDLPVQYGDYAVWQRGPDHRGQVNADLAFWTAHLRGAPTVLDLPADRPRPPVASYRGEKWWFPLDAALVEDLRRFSRQERASLFTVFAAALAALLHRYTGQEDILLGVPMADRERPELQHVVGFLLDTHVLRTDLAGAPSFRALMARVQRRVADLYEHRAAPFDEVVAALQPERSLGHAPLFQVMLNWRDAADIPYHIGLPGLAAAPLLAQAGASKFDLTLTVIDTGEAVVAEFEYSHDLFDADRIARMAGHLETLLRGAAADPARGLAELPLLTEAEMRQLLDEWNTDPAYELS